MHKTQFVDVINRFLKYCGDNRPELEHAMAECQPLDVATATGCINQLRRRVTLKGKLFLIKRSFIFALLFAKTALT